MSSFSVLFSKPNGYFIFIVCRVLIDITTLIWVALDCDHLEEADFFQNNQQFVRLHKVHVQFQQIHCLVDLSVFLLSIYYVVSVVFHAREWENGMQLLSCLFMFLSFLLVVFSQNSTSSSSSGLLGHPSLHWTHTHRQTDRQTGTHTYAHTHTYTHSPLLIN